MYLSVLAIFRDEAHILEEWIRHYLWQGFDHIYLIDNGSVDNPKNILQKFIEQGVVSYYYMEEKYSQIKHYNTAYQHVKSEWLLICDLDEFIFGTEKKLSETLRDIENGHNTIMTQWWMFGSSGHIKQPEEARTSFLYREEGIHPLVKSFYRVAAHSYISNVHSPFGIFVYSGPQTLLENGKIKVYHYPIQSWEYFENIKIPRGDAAGRNCVRDISYFENYDKNVNFYDDTLAKLVQEGYNSSPSKE